MDLQGFNKYLAALLLLGFCEFGWATPFPTPDPLPPAFPPGVTLGADIDGNGLFAHGATTLSIEVFDLVDPIGIPDFEFGFYYGSTPSVLTPIFQANDSAIFGLQTAQVNFTGPIGQVFDNDAGVLQSVFDNSPGSDPIGFYLRLFASDPILNGTTIFTQAILNAGGTDLAAAYPVFGLPSLVDGALLIGFRDPRTTDLVPIYASVIGSPRPPNPVPVPGAFLLWLTGLAGVALFRRRLAADKPVTATALQ